VKTLRLSGWLRQHSLEAQVEHRAPRHCQPGLEPLGVVGQRLGAECGLPEPAKRLRVGGVEHDVLQVHGPQRRRAAATGHLHTLDARVCPVSLRAHPVIRSLRGEHGPASQGFAVTRTHDACPISARFTAHAELRTRRLGAKVVAIELMAVSAHPPASPGGPLPDPGNRGLPRTDGVRYPYVVEVSRLEGCVRRSRGTVFDGGP
jgi:hypothetical protein